MGTHAPDRRIVIRNEFAAVSIEPVGRPGHQSLRIQDLLHGGVVHLDALELECLAWSQHSELAAIVDPGRRQEDSHHP